jgi:hypothetical protein
VHVARRAVRGLLRSECSWRIRDEAAKHLSTDDLQAAWSEGMGTRLDALPHLVDTLV